MKQLRNISMMTAAAAMTFALAAAQDAPAAKNDGKQRSSRVQDTVQQTPQRQPAPQSSPSQSQSQGNSRVPRNQFVSPTIMDRPAVNPNQTIGNQDQMRDMGRRGGRLHPYGARAGDWLRQYKDVPVDQQERALTSDPSFQRLPADQQEKLRQRLRRFNNLAPEKQDQLLDRMEKFETLPPEQRQRLQGLQERMRLLPEDRQQKVKRAFHQLKGMSPDQRQSYFGSDRFQTVFTAEEREILKGLNDIEGTPELAEPGDPREND
ncbi:MAG TPA: DUF3106 domain-containing protein [Terriglobales bacterium]|nr:DUF3106 domain-containing protein [Terriglobales bacterium]